MKTLNIICVLFGICLIAEGSSEAIKCYVCDDCKSLDESQLKTCSLQDSVNSSTTKTPPTTLSTESTTKSSEKPTTEPETKPPSEIISTTISPKPTQIFTNPPETERPIIVTLTPETSTLPNLEIEPTNTSIIEETQTTTSPIDISTEGIPEATEIIYPSETGSSESFNPITSGVPASLSEITPDETEEMSPIASVIPMEPTNSSESIYNRPSAVQAPSQTFYPDVSESYQPYPILNRVPREARNIKSTPSFHCYSVDVIDGDSRKVQKGCIEVPEEKAACEVLKDKLGNSVDKCKICTEDKCNSSSSLKFSIVSLVMVLVVFVSLY